MKKYPGISLKCSLLHLQLLASSLYICISLYSHNLKYMGIDSLGRLIKMSPEIAEQHQLAVIDCLEVRDILLLKTETVFLFLFFKISNKKFY